MVSQMSVFTIFHKHTDPLEQIGLQEHVWKYIIPHEAKYHIKKELDILKIRKFQLFPELESIGESLKN